MISTHVLDTSVGLPAAGVQVSLEARIANGWETLGRTVTDADGRVKQFPANGAIARGVHRLHFETGAYYAARGIKAFHPSVTIEFEVLDAGAHNHVPLLLTPFGFTTYRGS